MFAAQGGHLSHLIVLGVAVRCNRDQQCCQSWSEVCRCVPTMTMTATWFASLLDKYLPVSMAYWLRSIVSAASSSVYAAKHKENLMMIVTKAILLGAVHPESPLWSCCANEEKSRQRLIDNCNTPHIILCFRYLAGWSRDFAAWLSPLQAASLSWILHGSHVSEDLCNSSVATKSNMT